MNDTDHRSSEPPETVRRRQVIGVGAGLGVAVLSGCTASPIPGGSPTDEAGSTTDGAAGTDGNQGTSAANSGTFRLLISDQPVAIDEFDSLEVSFDRARVFGRAGDEAANGDGSDGADGGSAENGEGSGSDGGNDDGPNGENGDGSDDGGESSSGDGNGEGSEEDDGAEQGDQRGFSVIPLDGATVDLTQVVGDKAMPVYDGPLAEGRYTKIELYAAAVEGVVDGESVDVKIPSGKLQIVKPFEVVAGETLSFVFDINVVRKGQGGYNLLPVISESGVAGKDVDVNEKGPAGNASANPARNSSGNGTGPPDGQ